jgi:metal-responsive CopG/Arc/MetJ family transcriptional regulator
MGAAKRRKRTVPAIAAHAPKKIVVDFPEPLFRDAENMIAELSTSRSNFIRLAVEEYIRTRQQQKLERALIEGYTANANSARKTAEELQFD